MGFLKRKGDAGNVDEGKGKAAKSKAAGDVAAGKGKVPNWADFMKPDEYAQFRRLTDDWLRQRAGSFREIDGGGLEIPSEQGEPRVFGLANLAQKCHLLPRREWAAQIDGHFGGLFASTATTPDPDFDDVKSIIKVRIYPDDYAPPDEVRKMLVSRPVAPGMLAALVIDYPKTIATVNPDRLEKWGRTADELLELGLANVRAQDVPDRAIVENTSIRLLSGDSFFVATWVLMLEEHLEPVPEHGALVIVPNRHAVLFQPIVDVSIVNAVGLLLGIADAQCRQGPGSISPNLYWWKDGHLTLLPSNREGGQFQFIPPDDFVALLNSLAKTE
jgi:hypothetical protein